MLSAPVQKVFDDYRNNQLEARLIRIEKRLDDIDFKLQYLAKIDSQHAHQRLKCYSGFKDAIPVMITTVVTFGLVGLSATASLLHWI